MDLAPQWSLWDPKLARNVWIEPSLPLFFHQRIAERRRAAVVDRIRDDRVARSRHALAGVELEDLHWKRCPLEAKAFGALEHARGAARTPEPQAVGPALQRHSSHQADDA